MWLTLVPIIVQYGLPVAEKLANLIASNQPPSEADWLALKELTSQNARSKVLEVLARRGIDPASELGKAMIDMAG